MCVWVCESYIVHYRYGGINNIHTVLYQKRVYTHSGTSCRKCVHQILLLFPHATPHTILLRFWCTHLEPEVPEWVYALFWCKTVIHWSPDFLQFPIPTPIVMTTKYSSRAYWSTSHWKSIYIMDFQCFSISSYNSVLTKRKQSFVVSRGAAILGLQIDHVDMPFHKPQPKTRGYKRENS